jgi:hypothetical protein
MKSVLLDGTAEIDESGRQLCGEISQWLAEQAYENTTYTLREHPIQFCMGEFDCWVKTPGICRFPDAGRDIAEAIVKSDLVVCLTPVTFGGYSAELKKALDRVICIISPSFVTIDGETHHKARYDRYPNLLGIGLMDQPDEESSRLFATLVERNARNLHAPSHGAFTFPRHANAVDLRHRIEHWLHEEAIA